VDDAADAFLRAGASDTCNGDVFNVGGSEPIAHRDLVKLLIEQSGGGSVRFVEWPEDKRRIDIGSFYSDSSKFSKTTGWQPAVTLKEGLQQTLAYYRAHLDKYLDELPT
jgi:UDP-glucose 4-epimerase